MFNDEDPIAYKRMQKFSTVDGFVELTEDLSDMIKSVANEPSVGLFYIQKHTQSATPNLINLKSNVVEKSHETALHTEDLEDSITMVRSMKECGFPIAVEMIEEIKKSLSIMSTKQQKRGLISSSSSGYIGRTSPWSPATWGRNTVYSEQGSEKTGTYFSSVFKSAKQRTNNLRWPQVESKSNQFKGEKGLFDLGPAFQNAVDDGPLTMTKAESEDLLPSQIGQELQEESQLSKSLSHQQLLSLYDNYDEFKANREAKLEEWLGGPGNEGENGGKNLDIDALAQQNLSH